MSIPLKLQTAQSKLEAARLEILRVRDEHSDVFAQYDHLVSLYNEALQDAKNLLLENAGKIDDRVGEFSIILVQKTSPELVMEALGEDSAPFISQKLVVDRAKLDEAISNGEIEQDMIDALFTREYQIRGPKALEPFSIAGSTRKGGSKGKKGGLKSR